MKYNITTRSTCNINNKNKKYPSPQNNIESVNSKNKSPLFKIFMDNNNYKQKKLYLMRNTMNTLKENISKISKIIISIVNHYLLYIKY